ncbi:hypothetical protein ACWGB8_37720 [Kitasatospora sp. NPDC054939]
MLRGRAYGKPDLWLTRDPGQLAAALAVLRAGRIALQARGRLPFGVAA